MKNKLIIKLLLITSLSYIISLFVVFLILKQISYNYSFESIQDTLVNVKALRHFVSKQQKTEVYRLQNTQKLSQDYFQPQLLSSTFSAKAVNDQYNKIRIEKGLEPIKIRFAAENPRNLANKANNFESQLLKQFNQNSLKEYKEIKYNEEGKKIMYYAIPTKPLEAKCMRCHSTPDKAPKGLIEIYGDKNGFHEKQGSVRALLSTEYPLTKTDNFLYTAISFLALISLIVHGLFVIMYIKFTNQLIKSNDELQHLNENLEEKVKQETLALSNTNKQLREQKIFLDTLVQTLPMPLFCKDTKGNYIDVNKTFCDFTGFSKEEIVGKSVYDIAPKELADTYHAQDKRVFDLEENPQVYESKVVNKNTQEVFDVIFYKSPFLNEAGKVIGLIGTVIDITKRKHLEEEKLKNEQQFYEHSKMIDMGNMIGNIAHQWRQPLSVISTCASGIQVKKEFSQLSDEFLDESLNHIIHNTNYLSETIETFRNFIKEKKELQEVILQDRITNVLNIINTSLQNSHIKILNNIEDSKPVKINLILGELSQVLINIINNAKDALLEKDVEDKWIKLDVIQETNKVIITIEDNAGGIDKSNIEKIFDPYFTTKHQSQGTGLGLHMSQRIVKESLKGKLYVKNTENGAKFFIELPLTNSVKQL